MSDLEDVKTLLQRFCPANMRSRIATDSRLLHDLLIIGDVFLEFWIEFDPEMEINMEGFIVDDYFPSELSWDALFLSLASPLRAKHLIQRIIAKYKVFPVSFLIELKRTKKWEMLTPA